MTIVNFKRSGAVIVGNGISRKPFDLNHWRRAGPIYGCNALYRDFTPDLLIAFDDKIVKEIQESNFDKSKFYVPPVYEQYESTVFHNSPYVPRNNAGMVAMGEAIKRGGQQLFCLGMDFLIEEKQLNLKNIYDGTNAYGPETRASYLDTIARCRYFEWFAKQNSSVTFHMVFPEEYVDSLVLREIRAENVLYEFIINDPLKIKLFLHSWEVITLPDEEVGVEEVFNEEEF